MDIREKVNGEIEGAIDDIFCKMQTLLDPKDKPTITGDIDPLFHYDLTEKMGELSAIICSILAEQRGAMMHEYLKRYENDLEKLCLYLPDLSGVSVMDLLCFLDDDDNEVHINHRIVRVDGNGSESITYELINGEEVGSFGVDPLSNTEILRVECETGATPEESFLIISYREII